MPQARAAGRRVPGLADHQELRARRLWQLRPVGEDAETPERDREAPAAGGKDRRRGRE
jgi:hypothetical protein